MNGVPEESRDATGEGRAHGPTPEGTYACGAGSVSSPSSPVTLSISLNGTAAVSGGFDSDSQTVITRRSCELRSRTVVTECDQPPEGRRSRPSPGGEREAEPTVQSGAERPRSAARTTAGGAGAVGGAESWDAPAAREDVLTELCAWEGQSHR